jgi:TRAP-type mannitol/chloroaromatic compound transport system permease large subunit
MDILILLATLFICFASGVPIAFSLGIAALVGALWIGIPQAVMLKISDGVSKFAMLTIPFFVLAGAIMAEAAWRGGGHLRQRAHRPGAPARGCRS